MKKNRIWAIALIAVVAFSAAGCADNPLVDTVTGWFSGGAHKSKLRGQRISVMSIDETLRIDPTLATSPVVLPAPFRNPEWPEPGGYASNAMYHLEASGPLKVIWQADAGKASDRDSRLTAPPIIAEGRAYVLDSASHVFVFDANTGAPLWDKSVAPPGEDNSYMFGLFGTDDSVDPTKGAGGGIAYDGGRIFVSTGFGYVVALDAKTGAQIWKQDLEIPVVNAPVANGGRVFVSTQENHLYALAEIDGRRLWDHTGISESASIQVSTSAAVSGDYVLAPYSSGEIYALRVVNGRAAWNDMLTHSGMATALSELDDIAGRPVIDRDVVYVISHSGLMAAININTGERLWSRDLGGIQTPWAAGDYVYVLTTDAQLICLTRKEGKVKWIHQLPRWSDPDDKSGVIVWSGPILVSDKLIAVSSSGFAEAISPYTGELMARMEIPAGTTIAPVIANGTLYLYTHEAQLVALR